MDGLGIKPTSPFMRALLQRVSQASVTIDGAVHSAIEAGLLVLLGIEAADDSEDIEWLVQKITKMRIFGDDEGKMNCSLLDVGGEMLVVSQFTLYGDTSKGRRPTWMAAAPPDRAEPLVNRVVAGLRERGLEVATGRFRADMVVDLANEGPATLMLEV